MIRLSAFREHCAAMAEAEHKPDCPSLTAKKPYWDPWAPTSDGRGLYWRGPEPPWEPPKCDGCNPQTDRDLFAQMAAEVARYEQGELEDA